MPQNFPTKLILDTRSHHEFPDRIAEKLLGIEGDTSVVFDR